MGPLKPQHQPHHEIKRKNIGIKVTNVVRIHISINWRVPATPQMNSVFAIVCNYVWLKRTRVCWHRVVEAVIFRLRFMPLHVHLLSREDCWRVIRVKKTFNVGDRLTMNAMESPRNLFIIFCWNDDTETEQFRNAVNSLRPFQFDVVNACGFCCSMPNTFTTHTHTLWSERRGGNEDEDEQSKPINWVAIYYYVYVLSAVLRPRRWRQRPGL